MFIIFLEIKSFKNSVVSGKDSDTSEESQVQMNVTTNSQPENNQEKGSAGKDANSKKTN